MDKPKQDSSHKDNRQEDYLNWFSISNHKGWLVFKRELEKDIETYETYMDNMTATPELLKNYQLIKKGLQLAMDIPKSLEFKAKQAKRR